MHLSDCLAESTGTASSSASSQSWECYLEKPLDGRQSAKNQGRDAASIKLSLAQQQVLEQAEKKKNIFLTGCGGTGESFPSANARIITLSYRYIAI